MSIAAETSLRDLIRRIVTEHHGYLRRNLPALSDKLAASGDAELAGAFEQLRTELMDHLNREEAMLFPAIDRFESALAAGEPLPGSYFGSMRLPLQVLEQEHHIADKTLARVRDLSGGFTKPDAETGEALRALDSDLREHMRLENEELFPRVLDRFAHIA